ncbi:MAG: type II secretion system minor pseudopilin GspI [Ectothiorhodospiraceae bacterium]
MNSRGFTLLEVMVAVAVLAIAMAAVMRAGSQITANYSRLEERTLAQWVAGNILAERRAAGFWGTGTETGSSTMGSREWHWQLEVQETPNDAFRRLDVSVYATEERDSAVASMTGLVRSPGNTDSDGDAP